MQDIADVVTSFIAQATNVQVSFDRTLATIAGTFVLFLMGQLILAVRWAGKVSTTVETLMKRIDTMTADLGAMKASLTQIAVSEVKLEEHALRLQDHDIRIRTLEQSSWRYEGRRATDRSEHQ